MADGMSDDDVIHLASFNTHRSQGMYIEATVGRYNLMFREYKQMNICNIL